MSDEIKNRKRSDYPRSHVFIFAMLGALFLIVSAGFFYLWNLNTELKNLKSIEPVVFYPAPKEGLFLDAVGSVGTDAGEIFESEKKRLIGAKGDFIEANLKTMELFVYEKGNVKMHFPIKAKGKPGSWWETTTGVYSVGAKTAKHFSSISKVWMPYGIQFYGNFFIHGWPYYSDGRLIPFAHSGGCIRLLTEDAKQVYDFAKFDMPILVYDEKPQMAIYQALRPKDESVIPNIRATNAIVADLDTGEILVGKNIDTIESIYSITKLITALTASEVINLDQNVMTRDYMITDSEKLIRSNEQYRGFDMLYPLLINSSDSAARVLSSFIGESGLIEQINKKIQALGMTKTRVVDTQGLSLKNTSTPLDLMKLSRYIMSKRSFLFGVSRGAYYPEEKNVVFEGVIKKTSPFMDDNGFIGEISKESEYAGGLLSVWRFQTERGMWRRIGIYVSGKENVEDTKLVVQWFRSNFSLK
jgi:hypothetical protein